MKNLSEYLLVLQLFYYLRVLGGSTSKLKGVFYNNMSEIRSSDPKINDARKSAVYNYYKNEIPGTNIDSVKAFINQKIGSLQNKPNKYNNLLLDKFKKALEFLDINYTRDGAKKDTIVTHDTEKNPEKPAESQKPADKPAPLVPVKPTEQKPSAPAKPVYKTREQVIQELMSQGKITDPSQAVALSSPVTVNGRTFQALISPLGTLPGPGGVRVPIINDQQANSYAMSLLKEYNTLAGVGYQPLNDIGKGNLDPKNVEPLKKLLSRIDVAVKNKSSHEQTAAGEPILPQMREPKLSADTENLYKILKRLSGQSLDSKPAEKSVEKPAEKPADDVKKNDGFRSKGLNPTVTPANLVIDSSSLLFNDEDGKKIPGSDTTAGFFECILDWFEESIYYNKSNKTTEQDFIKRVSDCKSETDKSDKNKCWTEFPEFMLGKLSNILGSYRTPDDKIYKTLNTFIPLGVPINIQMIINLIEANDPRYLNLSESFIGAR